KHATFHTRTRCQQFETKIMQKRYWEQILEKSNKKQTLPYIIGCKKILTTENDFDSVENLLEEILHSENGKTYSMYHCPDIGEYVIFQNNYSDYLIGGLKVYNPITGNLKIVFGINMENLGKDFEQIKLKLSCRYESNIADEKFSFINRKWECFYNR
ncbi:hypothetical protein, partial [Confluentibacter citreus]|uniref:hypothetical protein n=1 Tax=Confluentibacter citreus TaxID=2007307 RepID=UPI00195A33AF